MGPGLPSFDACGSGCTSVPRRVTFRELLLSKCQEELDVGCRGKKCWSRERLLGCIYLMGHLFNRGYVCSSRVRSCVTSFLDGASVLNPEATEFLCKLLSIVGKLLETSGEGRVWMKQILLQLSKIADTLSARSSWKMAGYVEFRTKELRNAMFKRACMRSDDCQWYTHAGHP